MISSLLCLLAALFIQQKWRGWYTAALDAAFERTDIDNSGTIDRSELYCAVLEMYLQLNLYGLQVRAPRRHVVMAIMDSELHANHQASDGALDRVEFEHVMNRFLKKVAWHAVLRIFLTILAPVAAPSVCDGLRFTLQGAMPQAVGDAAGALNPSLDDSLVTMLLLALVGPTIRAIDTLQMHFWADPQDSELCPSKAAAQSQAVKPVSSSPARSRTGGVDRSRRSPLRFRKKAHD